MDDWVISNFSFCKQDSTTFSTPLCKDFYKINSKKWNCWVNSMSILSFSNTAKFLFRKVFSVGTITSRGCYLLPAFLERQRGREGILAGTWKWLGYGEAEERRQSYGGVGFSRPSFGLMIHEKHLQDSEKLLYYWVMFYYSQRRHIKISKGKRHRGEVQEKPGTSF